MKIHNMHRNFKIIIRGVERRGNRGVGPNQNFIYGRCEANTE